MWYAMKKVDTETVKKYKTEYHLFPINVNSVDFYFISPFQLIKAEGSNTNCRLQVLYGESSFPVGYKELLTRDNCAVRENARKFVSYYPKLSYEPSAILRP